MDEQLPNLPGVQLERKVIPIDDVSEDEDEISTCAFLYKGADRRKALEEMQKKRDAAIAEQAIAARLRAEAEEAPGENAGGKRKRGNGGGTSSTGRLVEEADNANDDVNEVVLDARDEELLEKNRQQQARLREMQKLLGADDDDDEETERVLSISSSSDPRSANARCGLGTAMRASRPGAVTSSSTNPNIWLRVKSDTNSDAPMLLQFTRDAPLRLGIEKLSARLGLLANRVSLLRENGSPLFLDLSPLEAGLLDDEIIVATETRLRVEEKRLKLKLCAEERGSVEVMHIAKLSEPCSDLAKAWCFGQRDPTEYDPNNIVLRIDGDVINPKQTIGELKAELDLDDGDMVEVGILGEATCVD